MYSNVRRGRRPRFEMKCRHIPSCLNVSLFRTFALCYWGILEAAVSMATHPCPNWMQQLYSAAQESTCSHQRNVGSLF